MSISIKLHDTVKVLSGKNKGKTGKVVQVLPEDGMVVVEGLNKMYKYIRPQRKGDKGQRIEFSAPLRLSKLMLVCPKCGKPTRINLKREGKRRIRVCKKCSMNIE